MISEPIDTTQELRLILREELNKALPIRSESPFNRKLDRFIVDVVNYINSSQTTSDLEPYDQLARSLITEFDYTPNQAIEVIQNSSRKIGERVAHLPLSQREVLQYIRKVAHQFMMLQMRIAQIDVRHR